MKLIIPVLPTRDIKRDVEWYEKYVGFISLYNDDMYAVLRRDDHRIHLQWHADTDEDPLLGGSVLRIQVDEIKPIFEEFVQRRTISEEKLRLGTSWNTNEFGFYDLNKNAIFIFESL